MEQDPSSRPTPINSTHTPGTWEVLLYILQICVVAWRDELRRPSSGDEGICSTKHYPSLMATAAASDRHPPGPLPITAFQMPPNWQVATHRQRRAMSPGASTRRPRVSPADVRGSSSTGPCSSVVCCVSACASSLPWSST